ncbi:MAG: DNA-processing protein DprA [Myxococcota bacterium]|jgi:DNA processing protein
MDTAERRVVAALWALPGIGVKTIERVREVFAAPGELYERPVKSWRREVDFSPQAVAALRKLDALAEVAERLEADLRRLGYRIIFPEEAAWPPALRDVAGAPPLLFMLGEGAVGPARRRVAIVGTRTPETGATGEVRKLAAQVAEAGVGVVSGGAQGIDRAAHLGALDGGGETWAFLGCAIEEMDSAQAVLRRPFREGQGTFFSQFPPGARCEKGHFLLRNACISGASEAVLVARAPASSGALNTVQHAREQGRPVLALPGDPWNRAAVGSNQLLRDGARLCTGVQDVLDALGLSGTVTPRPAPGPVDREPLGETAARVLAVLTRAPTGFDELLAQVPGVGAGALAAALLELELNGDALQRAGKRYERVS